VPHGSTRWTETTSLRVQDNGDRSLCRIRDVTQTATCTFARLEHQAFLIPHRVANRTSSGPPPSRASAAGARVGPFAVLYLDRQDFTKSSMSHSSPRRRLFPSCLQMPCLAANLRPAGHPRRLGGDESVRSANGLCNEQRASDGEEVAAAGTTFQYATLVFATMRSAGVHQTDSERMRRPLARADPLPPPAKNGAVTGGGLDEQLRTRAVGRLVD